VDCLHPCALVAALIGFGVPACRSKTVAHVTIPDSADPAARHNLEVIPVDETDDVLAHVDPSTLPRGASLLTDDLSGMQYARIIPNTGETAVSAGERLLVSLNTTVSIPYGCRLVLGDVTDDDGRVIAERTYTLTDASLVRETDVADVKARTSADLAYVDVTLEAEAARRLADATGALLQHRLVILVDGRVVSVPVLRARIEALRISISAGSAGSLSAAQTKADALAKAIRGH